MKPKQLSPTKSARSTPLSASVRSAMGRGVGVGEGIEDARQVAVLAEITDQALDFALGLGAVGATGFDGEAVVHSEIDE